MIEVVFVELVKVEFLVSKLVVVVGYCYVIVLMICVLVLDYVLEVLCYSIWVCLLFVFEGKGVVGGYSVIYKVIVELICL